jgi:hypothetical protein
MYVLTVLRIGMAVEGTTWGISARSPALPPLGFEPRSGLDGAHWQLSINNLLRWPLVVCGMRTNIFDAVEHARRTLLAEPQRAFAVRGSRSVAALYSRCSMFPCRDPLSTSI